MNEVAWDACRLLFSTIIHVRYSRPDSDLAPASPSHVLSRKGLSLVIDLDRLADADQQSALFSINKFNLLSFHESDYGPNHSSQHPSRLGAIKELATYVREVASGYMDRNIIHKVELITFPRIFGLSFNPISVYRCQNIRGDDCFMMYEVHNTFGDAHSYVAVGDARMARQLHLSTKSLHVSPFFTMKGQYQLLMRQSDDNLSLIVRYLDGTTPLLCATLRGVVKPLTNLSIVKALISGGHFPLRPLFSIHYEAVKLLIKKVPFFGRPQPPASPFTQAKPLTDDKNMFNRKS